MLPNKWIMRDFFIFMAAVLSSLLVFSCEEESPYPPYKGSGRVVVVYISANNNLSNYDDAEFGVSYADTNYVAMLEGYLPAQGSGERLLVFFHTVDDSPRLVELSRDRKGNPVETVVRTFDVESSSTAECVGSVLSYVKESYPSDNYGLILWSHSTGWLPEGYYENGAPSGYANPADAPTSPMNHMDVYGNAIVKMAGPGISPSSFGNDKYTGEEIDIIDLAAAIPMHLDFLIFDSCLMGCVEVAYQFRGVTDYFLASPTEVLANGFPYTHIMEPLFKYSTESALKEVADLYFHYYADSNSPYATVSVVDCSRLDGLASACRAIYEENRYKVPDLDLGTIQPYFRMNKHWFYDLGDFVESLEPSATLMADFRSAMDRAVIFKENTERFISFEITDFSGLSTYIQKPEEPYLDEYYRGLDWNIATRMIAE